MTMIWPQLIMSLADSFPHGCELEFITASAVSFCDALDGVTDGLISDIKACTFDPFSVVGTVFNCSGTSMQISQGAALVANATWSGPFSTTESPRFRTESWSRSLRFADGTGACSYELYW